MYCLIGLVCIDFAQQVAWTHLDAVTPRPGASWQSLPPAHDICLHVTSMLQSNKTFKLNDGCVVQRSHGQLPAQQSDRSCKVHTANMIRFARIVFEVFIYWQADVAY